MATEQAKAIAHELWDRSEERLQYDKDDATLIRTALGNIAINRVNINRDPQNIDLSFSEMGEIYTFLMIRINSLSRIKIGKTWIDIMTALNRVVEENFDAMLQAHNVKDELPRPNVTTQCPRCKERQTRDEFHRTSLKGDEASSVIHNCMNCGYRWR